jgi:hypothetical protein
MALTLMEKWELLNNDPINLRKRVETDSVRFAGYLMGLQHTDAKFNGQQIVYDKVMQLCRRVILAYANDDRKIFLSLAQRWIAAANGDLTDWASLEAVVTDYLITYHLETDVFLKVAGVTGDEFNPVV